MKKILSKMRAAIDKYSMISDNDNIAVAVSGGKDSLILLLALNELKKFYPKKFNLKAITVDPMFNYKQTNYNDLINFCSELNIDIVIKRAQIYKIVFEDMQEKNPCSLCAKIRRGILHDLALSCNCNKIALGHHMDDAVETFFMNLFGNGNISCFSPVTHLTNKNIYLIRPLIFCKEQNIESIFKDKNLPLTKSLCPVDKKTSREDTKKIIEKLNIYYPNLNKKIMGSIERGHISGW